MNPQETEKRWQRFWEKERIFSFDFESKKPAYAVDTPPPTVSGEMHLGHAFSYAQADFIARFKKMQGLELFYPFGYDDNGLATALFVEKKTGKKARNFSRKEFISLCIKESKEAEKKLRESFGALGLAADWELSYRTIDENSRKLSQYSFIDIYKKKRAYRKEAPTMWCPSCGTAIAQAELEDKEMDSVFYDLNFEARDGKKVVIATTRPEMLGACVGVFVHPKDKKNSALVGKELKVPLFDYWVKVKSDTRVDPEKGSGVVMCCTFGDQTDMEWFYAHNLELKMVVGPDGKMLQAAGKYNGLSIKEARKETVKDLKEKDLIAGEKPIKHSVNVHERCKTGIEFIVSKQWFIKYLDLKSEFISKAEGINWFPKHMKTRYDNWVNGLQWDWSLSRQRHYGVPFPVWYCKKCGEVKLAEEKQLPVDPLADKPIGKCKCGSSDFEPEKDVMDTWATSSLTPEITGKWLGNEKLFKRVFPNALRPQAHDIITLWAFNTIVKSLLHFGKLPWKNIMISGHALDPKGRKMSKSLGNAVDPMEVINKYGADVLRYWAGSATLGEDLPFKEQELITGRKFSTKLSNASRFAEKVLEGFDPKKVKEKELEFSAADKWILSRLNRVVKEATQAMEGFEYSKALNPARDFFWLEFADYYIEESKHRVYLEGTPKEKVAAQFTLHRVLGTLLKLFAPFLPHITEEIYQTTFSKFKGKKSIHLEQWPESEERFLDEKAEEVGMEMNKVISELRKHKNKNQMPLNSELSKVTVESTIDLSEAAGEIKATMHVKELLLSSGKELKAEIKG